MCTAAQRQIARPQRGVPCIDLPSRSDTDRQLASEEPDGHIRGTSLPRSPADWSPAKSSRSKGHRVKTQPSVHRYLPGPGMKTALPVNQSGAISPGGRFRRGLAPRRTPSPSGTERMTELSSGQEGSADHGAVRRPLPITSHPRTRGGTTPRRVPSPRDDPRRVRRTIAMALVPAGVSRTGHGRQCRETE
jgi:hypothetical protein